MTESLSLGGIVNLGLMKPAEHKVLDPADTPSPKPRGVRILSMDGGGIRGLYTLDILRALQRACGGRPVRECFDLIVGTSTGAFVAGCLAAGKDLDAIEAEYVKVSVSFVGATPGFFSNIMRLLYGHVIDPAVIHGLLRGFFGTLTLDALPATPALLLVATDPCVGVPRPFLFRNAPLSAAAGADAFPCETRCSVADALLCRRCAARRDSCTDLLPRACHKGSHRRRRCRARKQSCTLCDR